MRINHIITQEHLNQVFKEKDAIIIEIEEQVSNLFVERDSLMNSKSWRITAPLRALKRIFK